MTDVIRITRNYFGDIISPTIEEIPLTHDQAGNAMAQLKQKYQGDSDFWITIWPTPKTISPSKLQIRKAEACSNITIVEWLKSAEP